MILVIIVMEIGGRQNGGSDLFYLVTGIYRNCMCMCVLTYHENEVS